MTRDVRFHRVHGVFGNVDTEEGVSAASAAHISQLPAVVRTHSSAIDVMSFTSTVQNKGDLCTLVSTLYGYNSEVLCLNLSCRCSTQKRACGLSGYLLVATCVCCARWQVSGWLKIGNKTWNFSRTPRFAAAACAPRPTYSLRSHAPCSYRGYAAGSFGCDLPNGQPPHRYPWSWFWCVHRILQTWSSSHAVLP
jgi:hypothetical protein